MNRRIGVLISGRGSNLEAILRKARAENWQGTCGIQVVRVLSNERQARGLEVARAYGVAASAIAHADFPTREAFDAALAGPPPLA